MTKLLLDYAHARLHGGEGASTLLIAGAGLSALDNALIMLFVGNRAECMRRALPAWTVLAMRHADRCGWRPNRRELSREQIGQIARAALEHWICQICPLCEGRQFVRVAGAPSLLAATCGGCSGRGWVRYGDVSGAEHPDKVEQLVSILDARLHAVAGVLHNRMRLLRRKRPQRRTVRVGGATVVESAEQEDEPIAA